MKRLFLPDGAKKNSSYDRAEAPSVIVFTNPDLKVGVTKLLAFLLLPFVLFAQEQEEKPPSQIKHYKHSVKAGGGLPLIISNKPLRQLMDGVYSVNAQADFTLYKPVVAGVFYNYTMFDNAEPRGVFGRQPYVTKGFVSTAGASMGYEKFIYDDKVLSVMANSGYSWLHYKRSVTLTDTVTALLRTEGLTLGLTASYTIIVEETGGVGFYISYRYIDNEFEPSKVQLTGESSRRKTQFLVLGVIFTIGY